MIEPESAFFEAVTAAAQISAAPLLASFIVGGAMAIFQAVTQLHDQTLSFVPKLAAISLVMLLFGGWMVETMLDQFETSLSAEVAAASQTR